MKGLAILISVAAAGIAGTASAATILAVDFGLSTSSHPQSGFSEFAVANPGPGGIVSRTFGTYSVTIYNLMGGGRDRGSGATANVTGPNAELLRDLITNFCRIGSTYTFVGDPRPTNTTSMQIAGLQPSTAYDIQIWGLDRAFNNNASYTWFLTNSGSNVQIGSVITNVTGANVSAPTVDSFSTKGRVTTNASGQLFLAHQDSMGTGTLNGFAISEVPEPTVLATLATLSLLLGTRTRRRAI